MNVDVKLLLKIVIKARGTAVLYHQVLKYKENIILCIMASLNFSKKISCYYTCPNTEIKISLKTTVLVSFLMNNP